MSSGMDGGLQLSDIMAAFDIPDAENLLRQCPPPAPPTLEDSILVPPPSSAPALETRVPNMDEKVSNLIAPIASMASAEYKQGPYLGGPSPVPMDQQSNKGAIDFKHRLQSAPFEGPSSSPSLGQQSHRPSVTDFKQGVHLDGPASSTAYGAGVSTEFRHQHEAAMEFDQLEEHSQPVLVYSKEDWPSPDPNVHTSSDSVEYKANIEPRDQESLEMGPSSSKGVQHGPTTGISQRVRRTRSGGLIPQKEQRQIRKGNKKQTSKPSTPYIKKKLEPTLESDSLKPFRCVMTPEHRSLISKGLSDTEMIELLAELQALLRLKQRDSKRLRRARLTSEELEEDRRRNRERKRRSRQDPFIEFRHIMTDEQRKLLLQPDLDPTTRDTIMTELMAVKKWINREQKRTRRGKMTEEQRAEERRKSREYKRRARSNPLLAFKSVITEKHYELLSQDLDQEQRENLVQELIELRKAKQRDDMRNRRANFSTEQRDQERNYSRDYQRMRHQRTGSLYEWDPEGVADSNADDNERTESMPYPALPVGDRSNTHVNDRSNRVQDPGHTVGDSNARVNEQGSPMPNPGFAARTEEGSVGCESMNMETLSGDVLKQVNTFTRCEEEKVRNKIRQRRRRAMQTDQEKEEEKRKNRERSRMRRMRLAEIEKVVTRGRSQSDSLSNQAVDTGYQESMEYNHWKDVSIKTEIDTSLEQATGNLNTSCTSAEQKQMWFARPQSIQLPDQTVPWFTKQLMDQMRKKNRECTQRARASMTEEQREQERERNRERQRLRRLMQSPEERAAYIERQRNKRRRQRQDPVYLEKERERQRLRKKALRESPWYRAHESTLYQIRKARKTKVYMPPIEDISHQKEGEGLDNANQAQECGSTTSEDSITSDEYDELENELHNDDGKHEEEGSPDESLVDDEDSHDEKEENDSDFEDMYQRSIKDSKQESREELDKETREDVGDLRVKISTSIFGLHKIVPLNKP